MRFQGLAVIISKQRWPELIASERKKDLGLDAYAPVSLTPDGIGKGLACSLTATLKKIEDDIQKFQKWADDVKILLFATPRKVTNQTASLWADTVRKTYGIELNILPREDIITELMQPANASICRTHLRIPISVEPKVTELVEKAQEAGSEALSVWLRHPLLVGRPKIELTAVKLDQDGAETEEILDLTSLQTTLKESRRIILEAPAGRGKTTTLVQLAERQRDQGDLAFIIDLPAWVASSVDILEFIARMPSFLSQGLHPENLARLYNTVHCSFLLNGWNEVSDSYSEAAVQAVANLERNFPRASIIIATRTHHIRPRLPGSFRTRLLSLSRRQRMEYLQQALASHADDLITQLDDDPVLDDLTRTPLILAEVTTIFQSGSRIPKTKVGVLNAVMQLIEKADEHQYHLCRPPISGHSQSYLTELAVQMTAQGAVTITESDARSIVHSVSHRLGTDGQIESLPEPSAILNGLCAHHILERLEFPSVAFRFEHQQFQEFYAAIEVKNQLWALIKNEDEDGNRRLVREYLNRPVWEEPVRMIADEISELSLDPSNSTDALAAGSLLVKLSIDVDPVFTAELARLCGSAVWRDVQAVVSERLRSWYDVGDNHHRRCALAGMIASGAAEFIDILLPVLTSDNQQVRLKAYRAWHEFHISSLGQNWRSVVKNWKEEHIIDFIGGVARKRRTADIAEEFALKDPRPNVREAALSALQWVGAVETVNRVIASFDDEAVEQLLRKRVLHSIPHGSQSRLLAAYRRLLQKTEDPQDRLRLMLTTAKIEEHGVAENVKEELSRFPSEKIDINNQQIIESALELVRKADPHWVSLWVAERIADGSLWSDQWTKFILSIPENLNKDLLGKISGESLKHTISQGIISVLATTADVELAEIVFSKLCSLRVDVTKTPSKGDADRRVIIRQLEDLFHTMPANTAITGMLNRMSPEFDPVEYSVVIELLGRIGVEDSDLLSRVAYDLCQAARRYLKEGIPFALNQDDFSGHLKMHLALSLSRIGESEDLADLHRLIRADIDRVREGRAARSRGERSPMANGAVMSCSNGYVRAVSWLDPQKADKILLELLGEPEYEQDAATGLVRLARIQSPKGWLDFRTPDYRVVEEARSGIRQTDFDEDRRNRYTIAIKHQITMIMKHPAQSGSPYSFNGRLKQLAQVVAVLDGRGSSKFVLDIMALPGEWDGWTRVQALEALLFNGARLCAEPALEVLNPTIDYCQNKKDYDQQAGYLLQRCLCLLAFLDPPSMGISRIKEIIVETRFHPYELRELVIALGHSRCGDAIDLLLRLASKDEKGLRNITGEWIDAVAALDTPESKRVLLSFVDPDTENHGFKQALEHHDRERLASHITDIARTEPEIRDRLYMLCDRQLTAAMRLLFAYVSARMRTSDALVVGLNLVHDTANPPIPYEIIRGIENVFLEQIPYGNTGNAYSLEPRSANDIRNRLFDMILNDDGRRKSAWTLLGQTELWRLEYGRPGSEPRHPAINSGEPWPPIARFG